MEEIELGNFQQVVKLLQKCLFIQQTLFQAYLISFHSKNSRIVKKGM